MARTAKRTGSGRSRRKAVWDICDVVQRLQTEAIEATLPANVEQTMRQWLPRAAFDETSPRALAQIMLLAMMLEVATPSRSGATGYDRIARRRSLGADERTALAMLQAARFTPVLVRSEIADGLYAAENLATGEPFALFDETLPSSLVGVTLFALLVALDERTVAIAGVPTLLLDPSALAVAMDFVRPGRGIPHSHRCAAAVYRHIARHGGPIIPVPEDEAPAPTELDGLAARLVEGDAERESHAAILVAVRRLVSMDAVLEALFKAVRSDGHGAARIAAIYRDFAVVMIEALHLRALAGSGGDGNPLATLATLIDAEHATNFYPAAAVALFGEIRDTLLRRMPRRASDDLTRVIERIRALRAKTVDQGCTEEEALAAADKVAELLDRYGLSLGETELRGQSCVGMSIDSGRKRSGPLDDVFPIVAQFCDCRSWQERTAGDTLRSVFFGLPADVEAAQYLYERVAAALDTETASFRKGDLYGGVAAGQRQKATTSFQLGLVRGIGAKLLARKEARDTRTFAATGRDLVPVKAAVVDDELDKLGMAFTAKRARAGRMVLRDAFEAGKVASGRFEIQSELE